MDRRSFLKVGSATAAVLPLASVSVAQGAPGTASAGDATLNALFEAIFQDRVQALAGAGQLARPRQGRQRASEVGARRRARSRSARKEDLALAKQNMADLKAVPPRQPVRCQQSSTARSSSTQMETGKIPAEQFGIDSVQRPYPIFQQGGAYFSECRISSTPPTPSKPRPTPKPICRGWRWSRKSLDNDSEDQREQAARGYPRAGLVDRPDARPDAETAGAGRGSEYDGQFASSAGRQSKDIAGDWQKRAADDRRGLASIPPSTGRSR